MRKYLVGVLIVYITGFCYAEGISEKENDPSKGRSIGLTLDVEYDYDFNGILASGDVLKGRLDGINFEIPKGKYNQALKSGPGFVYTEFPTENVLSPRQGTVEMWVCPLNWDGKEAKHHVFFEAHGEGALCLFKHPTEGLSMHARAKTSGALTSDIKVDISSWKPGEWHHLAGTWSAAGLQVYVDGKPSGRETAPVALPSQLSGWFMVGDNPWRDVRTSHSLIDRVLIYDKILTTEEIAAHAVGNYGTAVPIARKEGVLSYEVNPSEQKIIVRFETRGAYHPDNKETQVAFTLTPVGQTPTELNYVPMQKVMTSSIPATDLSAGHYELSANIRQGTITSRLVKTVVIPSKAWKNNRLGLEDKVLPPWTPLQVSKQPKSSFNQPFFARVSCWGRMYEFDNMGLPRQIIAKGKELLAQPVILKLQIEGRPVKWSKAMATITSSSPVAVEINGSAHASTRLNKVGLKTSMRLEYDGLIVYQLRLDVPAEIKVDGLILDIPMRSEVALLRHRLKMSDLDRGIPGHSSNGALPIKDGVVDNDTYIPYAWLGDNDRGLFWVCESAQYWPNWTSKDAFEIVREGKQVVLRLNLMKPGQSLPSKWEFEFGLQATPVKPLPPHWRKWRWSGMNGATLAYFLSNTQPDNYQSRNFFGYPESKYPATLTKWVDDLHAKGLQAISYSLLHMISGGCPEFLWFGAPWHAGEGLGDYGSSDVMSFGAPLRLICPRSAEQADLKFSDFIVWKNKEYMEQYRLGGLYHDCANPSFCVLEGKGHEKCGWRDAAGKRHWNTTILPWRKIYRRIYAMAKEVNPDCFLVAHMSPDVSIPFLAYEDAYLDGEQFRGGKIKVYDDYLDVLPLDAFRSEFLGRQWGLVPFFLPEFDEGLKMTERIEPTRGLVALLMLHDVMPLPAYSNVGVLNKAFDDLYVFGYVDAEFIPYFDPVPPATTDMKDVYVSVYKRVDGIALAIIGNLSKEDRSGIVRLNRNRIGLPLDIVTTWPDKTPINCHGDQITLDIPRQGYRMLLIGNSKTGGSTIRTRKS